MGHSAGGLSLTDAIHRFASKIHMAVYVAANMLEHGFSTDQDFKDVTTFLYPFPVSPEKFFLFLSQGKCKLPLMTSIWVGLLVMAQDLTSVFTLSKVLILKELKNFGDLGCSEN